MKSRIERRMRVSAILALAALLGIVYCVTAGAQWYGTVADALLFAVTFTYFVVRFSDWITYDQAVYDCRIPLTLVDPMPRPVAIDPNYYDVFDDAYWEAVYRGQQVRDGLL